MSVWNPQIPQDDPNTNQYPVVPPIGGTGGGGVGETGTGGNGGGGSNNPNTPTTTNVPVNPKDPDYYPLPFGNPKTLADLYRETFLNGVKRELSVPQNSVISQSDTGSGSAMIVVGILALLAFGGYMFWQSKKGGHHQ